MDTNSTVPVSHPEACTCREHPLPATMKVRDARDHYLAENGFTVEAYESRWTDASFFGVKFRVPNTAKHRWGIMLHDLHHVATGYGTDLAGEGEISAWETHRGLRALGPYVGGIVLSGTIMGFALAPRRAMQAWRVPVTTASLFDSKDAYEALLELTVGELRERLGIPRDGLTTAPRALHAYAPRPTSTAANPA